METVLIPATSQSERTADVARLTSEIEDERSADIVVMHVFNRDEIESTRQNLELGNGDDESLDDLAARKAGVSAAVAELESAGFNVRVRGTYGEGEPGRAIVDAAETEDADRIYLYGKNRSPTGKVFFGSTVQRVLLNAHCPVVVLPNGSSQSKRRLPRVSV